MPRFLTRRYLIFLFALVIAFSIGIHKTLSEKVKIPSPQASVNLDTSVNSNGVKENSNYVATLSNFTVGINGFSFPNYGNEAKPTNLTPNELRRLFGERVCASQVNGECILTPPAEQWMQEVNEHMGAGHCDGMASLSLLMYRGVVDPNDLGESAPYQLPLEENERLQREIAYWWSTQMTFPTRAAKMIAGNDTTLKPSEVLDTLIQSFNEAPNGELYTLIIRKPDNTAGHAFTPFAIADEGEGKFAIHAYDNNHPDVVRVVNVDRAAETWSYQASTNPDRPESLYEGNAETTTLGLTPLSARLQPQLCPFCDEEEEQAGNKSLKEGNAEPQYNELWLDGEGQLLVTDSQNRKTGYVGGKLVREIPGAVVDFSESADLWAEDSPPTFYLPLGTQLTLTIDGSGLKEESLTDLTLIGPGYDVGVEGIKLSPNQKDTLVLSSDGNQLSYRTNENESPTLELGFDGKEADYAFYLQGVDLDGGGVINLKLEAEKGRLSINTTGNRNSGTYAIQLDRIDEQGEQSFFHDEVELDPNDTAYLEYEKWTGNKSSLPLGIDRGSTGTINETIDLTDDK